MQKSQERSSRYGIDLGEAKVRQRQTWNELPCERSSRDPPCEVTNAGSSSRIFRGRGWIFGQMAKFHSSDPAEADANTLGQAFAWFLNSFVCFSCLTFCLWPDSGVDAAVLEGFRWHSGKQLNLDACRNHLVLSICSGLSQRHPPDGDCALR